MKSYKNCSKHHVLVSDDSCSASRPKYHYFLLSLLLALLLYVGYLISGGKKHEIAGYDYSSWLSGKSDGSQFFISRSKIDFSELESVTEQEWLDKNIHDVNDAEIIKTILRLNFTKSMWLEQELCI